MKRKTPKLKQNNWHARAKQRMNTIIKNARKKKIQKPSGNSWASYLTQALLPMRQMCGASIS